MEVKDDLKQDLSGYCMYCDRMYLDFYEHFQVCPQLQEAYEEEVEKEKDKYE